MLHKPMVSADDKGVISLWCICDQSTALITYDGDWVALDDLVDVFDKHYQEVLNVL